MSKTGSPIKYYRIATGESLEAVGRRFGVNKSTVLRWERNRVPAERVHEVERKLGLPRSVLRPDLWPPLFKKRSR